MDKRDMDKRGMARRGKALQARRGLAGLGEARHGLAGEARLGAARRGQAGHGLAGKARRGAAGQGADRQGRQGRHQHNLRFEMENDIKTGVQMVAQQIFDATGKVSATALVEAARPEDSPAHGGFQWDDSLAGAEYRLIQARQWFRVIAIKREPAAEPEKLVHIPKRVVIADEDGREGFYRPISAAAERPDEFARALEQATSRLDAARRAVDELLTAAARSDRSAQAAVLARISAEAGSWADQLRAMH